MRESAHVEVTLPDIWDGSVDGEIARWYVAPGDRIWKHQPLVEVLTDKALVEIPAPASGQVVALGAGAGARIPVGSVIALIKPYCCAELVASPLVRRLAREKGLDLRSVPGTGRHGRITRQDLELVDPAASA